jgi:hypothetical protein
LLGKREIAELLFCLNSLPDSPNRQACPNVCGACRKALIYIVELLNRACHDGSSLPGAAPAVPAAQWGAHVSQATVESNCGNRMAPES